MTTTGTVPAGGASEDEEDDEEEEEEEDDAAEHEEEDIADTNASDDRVPFTALRGTCCVDSNCTSEANVRHLIALVRVAFTNSQRTNTSPSRRPITSSLSVIKP